jgi:biopolymer transport protein ExbB
VGAADATAGAAATNQRQSYVAWFLKSSGLIGLFILGLTVYFATTVVRLYLDMRPDVAAPPEQMARCEQLIQQRDLKQVFSYVLSNNSCLCRMLTVGLMELPHGLAEARDTMERHGEAETVEMEKRISMLAVLGTLGPMIGLIGTLKGMIASFSVIAVSDVQLKASEVAGGISEALLLTFEGVALSVPAIYFFAVFRNRVSSISVLTMLQADKLLRQFAHAARLRTGPATPAVESAAA